MLKLCGELACGERTRKVQLVLEKVEVQTYTNGEWPRGTPFEKFINGKLLRCFAEHRLYNLCNSWASSARQKIVKRNIITYFNYTEIINIFQLSGNSLVKIRLAINVLVIFFLILCT